MNNACWKCGDSTYGKSVRLGLCEECSLKLGEMLASVGVIIIYGFSYYLVPTWFSVAGSGIFYVAGRLFAAIVVWGLFISIIAFGLLVLGLFLGIAKIVIEWGSAIHNLILFTRRQRRARLQLEAKQRAELAEPLHLDGIEIDRLLTEQQMERNGWK